MKTILMTTALLICQLAYPQTDCTLLDGKQFCLGDSLSKIQSLFPAPWYSLEFDSTNSNFRLIALPDSTKGHFRVAVIKEPSHNGESETLLAWLEFVEHTLEGVTRFWVSTQNSNSFNNSDALYNALKSNFENGTSVKLEFSDVNSPNSNKRTIRMENAEGHVFVDLTKTNRENGVDIYDQGGSSFGEDPFSKKEEYCLTFVDYAHLAGHQDVISELFKSKEAAERRLRQLTLYYLSTDKFEDYNLGVNNWSIMKVTLPDK